MKLNQVAFANSLAVLSAIIYILFYIVGLVSPTLFRLLFNSQFLGADVASLYKQTTDPASAVISIVVVGVTGWIFGYVWAWMYNYFAKK